MSDPFRETPKKSRSSRHSKPGEPLDQIDRLDGSGQFGSATFHHDGPFDAVRPHRNRSNSAIKPAPLDAFPIDGANNQLLSVMSAHNTANITSDNDPTRILLTNADNEAFNDFNQAADPEKSSPKVTYTSIKTSPGTNPYSIATNQTTNSAPSLSRDSVINFDSSSKADPVHGNLTTGLGTSTFLDGAPAPNSYLKVSAEPGVSRKKSLIKKLIG